MYFHGRKSLVEVDMLPWRFPWKLVSVDLLPWNLVNASMEIHRSFHSRWKWTLPLLRSIAALTRTYSAEASMSFHIPQHTSAYFHESIANSQLLSQDFRKGPSTSVRSTSRDGRFSINFHGNIYGIGGIFISTEVYLLL